MKSQCTSLLLTISLRISRGNIRRTNGRRRVTAVNCRARRGGGSSSFLPDPRVLQEGSRDLIKARRRVERRVATSCKLELTRWPPNPPPPPSAALPSYLVFYLRHWNESSRLSFSAPFERISLENSWERCTRLERRSCSAERVRQSSSGYSDFQLQKFPSRAPCLIATFVNLVTTWRHFQVSETFD